MKTAKELTHSYLGGDKRLLQAHQKAVDDALKELETYKI
jgi:hypothetical protein